MISNAPTLLQRPTLMAPIHVYGVEVHPLDAMLPNPFPIASDQKSMMTRVSNVLVSITTRDGITGFGEAAPFFGISGDDQKIITHDLEGVSSDLIGSGFNVFELEEWGKEALGFSSARAALEMAYFDILAKQHGVTLGKLIKPESTEGAFITDITIPIIESTKARTLAADYAQRGFNRIKVKVGTSPDNDLERIISIDEAFRETVGMKPQLLLDANEGYTAKQAIRMLKALHIINYSPTIFEQPVKRYAVDELRSVAEVADEWDVKVLADESVCTVDDAKRLADARAVHGLNLKVMKHGGLIETLRIAEFAIAGGMDLMIGGMMETRLAMTVSLHLSQAIGSEYILWLDLDTPLLLQENILNGGITYRGPNMQLPDKPGIGVEIKRR